MSKNPDYYKLHRPDMAGFLPEEYHTVLEIGCGEGNFSSNLKSGCELWGVELNSSVAKKASQRMHRVLNGKYENVSDQLPNDYFDLVVCNDVIEHMEDYDAFFCSIRKKLRQNAHLIGSIPNVRYYLNLTQLFFRKDWHYTNGGVLDRTHLRFFTEKSLKRLLNQHYFVIERFEGINKIRYNSFNFSLKNVLHFFLIYFLITITFGSHADVLFLRFGFRIKKGDRFQ